MSQLLLRLIPYLNNEGKVFPAYRPPAEYAPLLYLSLFKLESCQLGREAVVFRSDVER